MLTHDFVNMASHSVEVGANPLEVVDQLRCQYCYKSPSKAASNGCATREVKTNGKVLLSDYNPDGKVRFVGRICETCNGPIMSHWLRDGTGNYFCDAEGPRVSAGLVPVAVDENEYWPQASQYYGR